MKRWLREFRLIPVVLIAVGGLLALKVIGLLFDGGYTLGQRLARSDTLVVTTVPVPSTTALSAQTTPLNIAAPSRRSRPSWMQEMFNYPDVTGSVGASKPAAKEQAAGKDAAAGKRTAGTTSAPSSTTSEKGPADEQNAAAAGAEPPRPPSAAERAILERLQARRQEIEARARELEARENLLKEAEQRLDQRAADAKAPEPRPGAGAQRKEDSDNQRFKSLVTMYESMKPKEAAKIFDRLDIRVLLEVASKINPRRMSEILAQMSPEAAERLTVELASRASGINLATNPADLPKIEGRPGN
jgi:flagellar motility protein MotE (MotC chaperone)